VDDTVTLSGLERVALKPLTFRIVTAQPEHPYRPRTLSKAPSLKIEFSPVNRLSGTLTIRNYSKKAVTAFLVGNGAVSGEGRGPDGLRELVAPGAAAKFNIQAPTWGWNQNGTYVYGSEPPALILEAALFADDSYEGDGEIGERLVAQGIGAKIQWQRIRAHIDPIVADVASDDQAKIKLIRTFLHQLSEEPDPQMSADLRAQFPGMSDRELPRARFQLGMGMNNEKIRVDTMALNFEEDLEANVTPHRALAEWWVTVRGEELPHPVL
jgi:hypothetical protein